MPRKKEEKTGSHATFASDIRHEAGAVESYMKEEHDYGCVWFD
jgi:hypothetical protein